MLALALVAAIGVREAILLSVIPGLLAAVAIVYAIRRAPALEERERQPIRLRIRPVMRGQLGRMLGAIAAFELGNLSATLLILRATDLLEPGRSHQSAVELALVLYTAYNVAATLSSIPAGHAGDRLGNVRVLALGAGLFAVAFAGFALTGESLLLLAVWFCGCGRGDRLRRDRRERRRSATRPDAFAGFGVRAAGRATERR